MMKNEEIHKMIIDKKIPEGDFQDKKYKNKYFINYWIDLHGYDYPNELVPTENLWQAYHITVALQQ